MSKPLGTVLLEGMAKAKATAREYKMVLWVLRIVIAEVHKFLNGTRPGWEVIDALEAAAAELREHGDAIKENC